MPLEAEVETGLGLREELRRRLPKAKAKRQAVVRKERDPASETYWSSTETGSYSSVKDKKFVTSSRTKDAWTKVAYELMCAQAAADFVETVPVLEVRLKPNSDPGLAWAARSTPESHESGPAPESQWRATCVSRAVFHYPFRFRVVPEATSGSQLDSNSCK